MTIISAAFASACWRSIVQCGQCLALVEMIGAFLFGLSAPAK